MVMAGIGVFLERVEVILGIRTTDHGLRDCVFRDEPCRRLEVGGKLELPDEGCEAYIFHRSRFVAWAIPPTTLHTNGLWPWRSTQAEPTMLFRESGEADQVILPVLLAGELVANSPSGNPRPAAAARHQMNDEHHDTDEEEDPRDLRGYLGYPEESEDARDEPDHEKDERVIEHWFALLAD